MSPHRQGDQGYRKLTVYSLAFAAYKLTDCYNDNIVIRHPILVLGHRVTVCQSNDYMQQIGQVHEHCSNLMFMFN